ncbi:MAG TPA: cupin domain-containing protein [Gemmataceae bacterium]|nr:cupin domain-containing protein [Gemmataceae bacterium]
MAEADFDLRKLLAPVEQEIFLRDYWEKQPLHLSRKKPGHYSALFSSADVDTVIAFTRPKFADASAFKPEVPRQSSFVQGWLADRHLPDNNQYPGIAELHAVYARGKTVVIMTMQQRWLPIALLCRKLESFFYCPVHANLYLTPAGAQGFDAHFDTHEVLVLQLEGHKHWRLYGPTRTLPMAGERFSVPREQLGPVREIHLEPGDLLYIPRGHVHEAFTSEAASMHLTVGINVFRWADLLHEAIDSVTRRDERFRESVPSGLLGGGPAPADVAERFRELLDVLGGAARVDDAMRQLGDAFFGQMPVLPDSHFAAAPREEAIDLDTVLEKSPGAVCRVVQDGSWVTIEFPGGRVGGPLKIASALHFVAGADRFAVRELPDDLGGEAKLVLVRRLLRERLLLIRGKETKRAGQGENGPFYA